MQSLFTDIVDNIILCLSLEAAKSVVNLMSTLEHGTGSCFECLTFHLIVNAHVLSC